MNLSNIVEIDRKTFQKFLDEAGYQTTLPSKIKGFGLYNDSELIGVVGLYKTAWHTTEIRGLCVKESYRKKGIGGKLVEFALQKVETPLCTATVVAENIASQKVFLKNKFCPVAEFKNTATGHEVVLFLLCLRQG